MFTIYHSNQLNILTNMAATIIKNQPLCDPLQPEIIIVQSTGIAQWMQIEFAIKFGIAANIEFTLPTSFIWQMFTSCLSEIPAENPFSKQAMTWQLMDILVNICQQGCKDYNVICQYLRNDSDQRKCFQFAKQVADLFDQYLVYRPDWLNSWQNGNMVKNLGESQRWQALLWKALVEEKNQSEQQLWHCANFYQYFIQILEHIRTRPPGLPERVFICGISALPPIFLQVLQALGRHIDIHFLFTNPCRYYWSDICDDRGRLQLCHPLLASWGKLGRDSLYLLSQLENIKEIDAFIETSSNCLLKVLQRDILELENHTSVNIRNKIIKNSLSKRPLQSDDYSLCIHICHSIQREVEVLHDSLLAMLTDDPSLLAREIIVMVPDIDQYIPAIQAVFNNSVTAGRCCLPFTISDRRARHIHPVLTAFFSILELPNSRFTAEQVLTLLEVPALASRFSIDDNNLKILRHLVTESGIRWGLDDNTLQELQFLATGQHTWHFGLTRMLLGYAMNSQSSDWRGILPYDDSGGMLVASLAGQLAEFLTRLQHWRNRLAQPRKLEEWLTCVQDIIDDFFTINIEVDTALTLLKSQWQQMLQYGLESGYDRLVSIKLLSDELSACLNHKRINQRFLTGAITFCSLMPMRSIPFKVVCLLGMNNGVYPRTLPKVSFDLMTQQKRRGDRSQRDDDCYLFLEALLSAQQRLYISYIGCALQDNTPRYPSFLVSELCEYIEQSFYLTSEKITDDEIINIKLVRAHLWQWHSRMPFDPENFIPGSKNQSFFKEWLPTASMSGEPYPEFVQPLKSLFITKLSFEALHLFYSHPVRFWFHQRLSIRFCKETFKLAADEPFVIDNLTRYQLNKKIVNVLINRKCIDKLYQHVRSAGQLPYGAFGELIWNKQCKEMTILVEQIQKFYLPENRNIEIFLTFGDIKLSGWLPKVQVNGLLRWYPRKLTVKDSLLLWLEHLVYCAIGGKGESRMFGIRSQWHFAALPTEEAKEHLFCLISGYCQGMIKPLLLLNRSSSAWLAHCFNQQTKSIDWTEDRQRQARDKLIQAWHGNRYVNGEKTDPYLRRIIHQLDDTHIQAIVLAARRYLLFPFMLNLSKFNKT